MSARCKYCEAPIEWVNRRPMDPATKRDHRDSCSATRGQVPDKLKRPSAHHTAAYKLKLHEECQYAYFLRVVQGEEGGESTGAQDSGKLEHAVVEYVAVDRDKRKDFASPVTPEELLAALDVVVGREAWDGESLAHAREVLVKAAPKIDLAFVGSDEHGPFVERKFELPVGAGVLVGGIMDLVEFVGETVIVRDWKGGQFRDPNPRSLPAVGLYAEWASLLWPERDVRVVLQYLALDVEDEIAGEQLVAARGHAKALARAVVTKTRTRAQNEEAWPATFGGHCARCPFTSKCSTFKQKVGTPLTGREPETLEELVAEIHRLAPVATIVEKRVKDLRKRAIEFAAPIVAPNGRALVAGYPIKLKTIQRDGYTVKPSTYQQLDVDDPEPMLELVKPATIGTTESPHPVLALDGSNPFALKPGTPGTVAVETTSVEVRFDRDDNIQPAGAFPEGTAATARDGAITRESRPAEAAETTPVVEEKPASAASSTPEASAETHTERGDLSRQPPAEAAHIPIAEPAVEASEDELERAKADAEMELRAAADTFLGEVGEPVGGVTLTEVHAENCGCEKHGTTVRRDPTPTPAFGTVAPLSAKLTVQAALDRLGVGQVRHAEDLEKAPENEPSGLSSAILNLAARGHGEERVNALWRSVGGEFTGGQRPRRKSLTGGQLRRVVMALPPIFHPAHEETAPPISAGQPTADF